MMDPNRRWPEPEYGIVIPVDIDRLAELIEADEAEDEDDAAD